MTRCVETQRTDLLLSRCQANGRQDLRGHCFVAVCDPFLTTLTLSLLTTGLEQAMDRIDQMEAKGRNGQV